MLDLTKLDNTHLVNPGWNTLIGQFPGIAAAQRDHRFFKKVDRFKQHLREIVSIAVELNSNYAAAEQAYAHVKENKFVATHKAINQFEDIQKQTYKICIQALETDLKAMCEAFDTRNAENLELHYAHINRWPIRFKAS